MAEVQPFRAFRYDLGRVGALESVIAPPYDVIDAALLKLLAKKSPYNIVRVDLPQVEAGDADELVRYSRAGRTFKDWLQDGIIKQDSARGLYVYHQDFEVEGKTITRRGFLARIKLESFDSGIVLPHEETLAGPKLDRLRLMQATGMNLSPGFGLYVDQQCEIQNLLDQCVSRMPPCEAPDHLGVKGRIWPVTDQQILSKVVGLMGPKTILIADGHHRYETSLAYRDQSTDDVARYSLMMFVGMSDPGLVVLPTHRLVSGCGPVSIATLTEKLGDNFTMEYMGTGPSAAQRTWDALEHGAGQGGLAFGAADGWVLAKPRDLSQMTELAREHTQEWRDLSVSILHRLVLGRLVCATPGNELTCEYVHRLDEVLASKSHDLGVLVPAVPVDLVHAIAAAGERMPAKSTYFYPKLQTGFLFNSLKVN